ncbi:MAG: hypothetical protein J6A46_04700, partial [Clostridia bacterium]|nr:hypothetical protein [Clostridia bacterium]
SDTTSDTTSSSDTTSDTTSSSDTTSDTTSSDDSTPDVTPDVSDPLSGTGTWAPDYSYVDYFIIETGKTYCATVAAQEPNWGSAAYQLTVTKNGMITVSIPEYNEGVVTISIDGVNETITDGYSFCVAAGSTLDIWIGACDAADSNVYLDAYFSFAFDDSTYIPNGSKLAPLEAVNGTTYTIDTDLAVFYTFTAPTDGQFKFTVNGEWNDVADFLFYDQNGDPIARGCGIDIEEGQTISFYVVNGLTDSSWNVIPCDWTFTFGEALENDENYDQPKVESPLGSEENAHVMSFAFDFTISVEAETVYYIILEGALQFVVPEGFTAMTGGSNRQEFAAGETLAFSDYDPMMMNAQLYVMLYNTTTEAKEITLTVSEISGGDVGGEEVSTVLDVGDNTIVITEADLEVGGVIYTFTAPITGQYTFASNDLIAIITDSNGMMVGRGMVNLTAGETYNVTFGPLANTAGTYTVTLTVPADGSVSNPFVIESVPTTLTVSIKVPGESQVCYTYVAEATGNCVFTFEISDTWLVVEDTSKSVWSAVDGHSQTSYVIPVVASETYTILIGTWEYNTSIESLTVSIAMEEAAA